jgi:formate dehydrogenase subunit gamma
MMFGDLCRLSRASGLVLAVFFVGLAGLWGSPSLVSPAMAQSSGNVPGKALGNVNDSELWRQIRRGASGTVSIPDKKAAVLINSSGESWRATRNGPISTYGGWALAAVIVALAVFFMTRGQIKIEGGLSGRLVRRFTNIEVVTHWLTAFSFIILALSGLNTLYGKYFLLPVIGQEIFAMITSWGKFAHNYIAYLFILGIVTEFVLWVKDNLPDRHDAGWLAQSGGIFKKGVHPPAGKFNVLQKIIFWILVIGSGFNIFTGLNLLFPLFFMDLQGLQLMLVLHSISGLVLVLVIIIHIYIGTIGMEGALDGMRTGYVDETWLKEHHSAWSPPGEEPQDAPSADKPEPA